MHYFAGTEKNVGQYQLFLKISQFLRSLTQNYGSVIPVKVSKVNNTFVIE